jgi:hypothetical protein
VTDGTHARAFLPFRWFARSATLALTVLGVKAVCHRIEPTRTIVGMEPTTADTAWRLRGER